jgi:hypothetical protein
MFIQLLIYNYNAYELLLVASKLAFAFKCMGHINTYNGIVVLLLIEKEKRQKIFQPIVLGLHDYTSICSTNNYDIIPRHSWLPFS